MHFFFFLHQGRKTQQPSTQITGSNLSLDEKGKTHQMPLWKLKQPLWNRGEHSPCYERSLLLSSSRNPRITSGWTTEYHFSVSASQGNHGLTADLHQRGNIDLQFDFLVLMKCIRTGKNTPKFKADSKAVRQELCLLGIWLSRVRNSELKFTMMGSNEVQVSCQHLYYLIHSKILPSTRAPKTAQ